MPATRRSPGSRYKRNPGSGCSDLSSGCRSQARLLSLRTLELNKSGRKFQMYISLAESLVKGFRRWSDAHQPCGNDNEGGVARLDALAAADLGIEYAVMMPPKGPRDPWLVPGWVMHSETNEWDDRALARPV